MNLTANRKDTPHFDLAVRHLLHEAMENEQERRAEQRRPYFKPVSLTIGERHYHCFSRDISATGVGLLHYCPIEVGEVNVTIYSDSLGALRFQGELLWCKPAMDGWFLSGVRLFAMDEDR